MKYETLVSNLILEISQRSIYRNRYLNVIELSRYFVLMMMFLRWLTVLACLRTSSPYTEFYEEFLMMKSPSDFGGIGVVEDEQGGDHVEVHYT